MISLYTDLELRVREFGRKVRSNEDGAGMVEYALLVALVGVMLITAIGLLTGSIEGVFDRAKEALDGAPAGG